MSGRAYRRAQTDVSDVTGACLEGPGLEDVSGATVRAPSWLQTDDLISGA